MLIKLFILFFIFLLASLAAYLLKNLDNNFVAPTKKATPKEQQVKKLTAVLLIGDTVLGLILLFFLPEIYSLITLGLASLAILYLGRNLS